MKLTEEELNVIKSQSNLVLSILLDDQSLSMWFELKELLGYRDPRLGTRIHSIENLLQMDEVQYLKYIEYVILTTKTIFIGEPFASRLPFPILHNAGAQIKLKEYYEKYSNLNLIMIGSALMSVELCQLKMKKCLTLQDVEKCLKDSFVELKASYQNQG